MAVTMKDIAREAGVSHQAVSAVLTGNSNTRVSKEKREKISMIAKNLGYQRNELAATTRTGVNRTIALIGDFEKSTTFFINDIISGILTSATKNKYGVKVYSVEQLKQCLGEILSYRMKNVIVVSMNKKCRKQVSDFCKKNDLKLVYVLEKTCGIFPTIASADRVGMRDAVLKFAELGHKRISLICSEHGFHYKDERHAGYLEGLKLAGIDVDENLIDCSRYNNDSLISIQRMLDLPKEKRPTAFLCIADSRAAQVINQTIKNGLRVPDDISVIGFGNDHLCESVIVPLTSISQSFKKMGNTAFNLVLGKDCDIKPNSKNEYLLDTELINRESVANCKSSK